MYCHLKWKKENEIKWEKNVKLTDTFDKYELKVRGLPDKKGPRDCMLRVLVMGGGGAGSYGGGGSGILRNSPEIILVIGN